MGVEVLEAVGESPAARLMHSRDYISACVNRIPPWKRFIICQVFRRKQWRVARAFNTVAVHAINVLGDDALYSQAVRLGDREWVNLYRRNHWERQGKVE
jgi:hypothetical protein